MSIKIKRIYESPSKEDGKRILVDRLWPRGISKEKAKVDMWLKDIAPSTELRKWYGHIPEKHEEFKNLYEQELSTDPVHRDKVNFLEKMSKEEDITLLYGARDITYNHAIILLNWIVQRRN
jgi:uncharacterized protein YeaO (DUF488 family)